MSDLHTAQMYACLGRNISLQRGCDVSDHCCPDLALTRFDQAGSGMCLAWRAPSSICITGIRPAGALAPTLLQEREPCDYGVAGQIINI